MSHPLASYVRILARGKNGSRSMDFEEARFCMQEMLSGNALPEQIGAIFMLLRVKEESAEELAGFAAAINELWPKNIQTDIIWPSYAGKRRQPFWCFLSMLLLNQMGYRILAHGTESHTEGRLYLHQIFEAFDLPVIHDKKDMHIPGPLAYLPCAVLNPVLQQWLGLKSVLGVRSPINTVMKTIAPENTLSVQGVFHPNYAQVHADAARINQRNCVVIKGEGGEFEVNPERKCLASLCLNGKTSLLEIPSIAPHYEGKSPDTDIQWLERIWNGEDHNPYAEDSILKTAALARYAMGGPDSYDAALSDCRNAWQKRLDQNFRLKRK